MVRKPSKRERELVYEWRANFLTVPQLAKKLKKSRVGAYTTIARVYKYDHFNN